MKKTLIILLLALLPGMLLSTETENHGLRVLPAPGPIVIDGNIDDWDLSGGIFACGELEHLRDNSSVWLHAMYDSENLYLLARWKDPTPLNNPESLGGHGFNGDCLEFRCILFPDVPAEKSITWWDAWRDNQGRSIAERSSPGEKNSAKDNNLMPSLDNAVGQGVKQAFKIDADGKGYVQEIAIPWKMLSPSGRAPKAGERFRFTIEPNFTAGAFGRITIKDIFSDESKAPDRIFTFRAFKDWGWATLEPKGKVDPQPVRIADGRTFPVTMSAGVPTVDWTGLVHHFEWPGFKPITFDMPMDGYVSLNLIDSNGTVVRHLLNQDARQKGPVTVQWDGLTDATYRTPGQPVPAGDYTWKAIAHPGATLTLRGWASFSGRAPWQATPNDFWLGDHGVPSSVVTDGKRMYLACNGAEGGRHLIATDFDGTLLWSLQNTTGAKDPEVIAVDRDNVYVAHPGTAWMITRVDANTGAYKPWATHKNHMLAKADVMGSGVKSDAPGGTDDQTLVGLDARDGLLYCTTGGSASQLLILDGDTGALKKTFPLPSAGAIKGADPAMAYVICGDEIRTIDLTTGATKPFISDLANPTSLNIDNQGRILVSLGEPDHQVAIFGPDGAEIARIGEKGGRQVGPWQPDRMLDPAGIAVDPKGQLWVMEHDRNPKRVSVWAYGLSGAPAKTALLKEFFGPTHYGASGGAINPRDPDLMVGEGCEWRIGPKGGQAICLGTFDRSYHEFATYREGSNGRLYLVTNKMKYGKGSIQIWERLGDARYALRAELSNDKGGTELWTDLNGDGERQPNEIQCIPSPLFCAGSNSWSLNLGPDLTFYGYDPLGKKLEALTLDGFTGSGAPKYDLAKLKPMPDAMSAGYQPNYSCAMPDAENKTILVNLAVKDHPAGTVWHCFDLATGKLLWTYPNPYFQVHGSHHAPAPEPGLFRGAYGPVGSATLPGVGSFWAINGNLGEWWVLSSDGFFVTRLFNGNVFEWKWPAEPLTGSDMTNLPAGSGGEDFGGSMTQAKNGKVYIQAGKAGDWNVALDGLEKTVAIPGGKVDISAADTTKALALREQTLQKTAGGTLAVRKATIAFSGSLDRDFKGGEIIAYQKNEDAAVRTALAWDDANLYIGWQVKDATPWVNGAQDISQMYSCGDTVDLQLGADPAADPKRAKAVKGDLRLSIGNYKGKPTAVLYRFVSDEKKPRIFSSGVVRGWQVDWVDVLAEAQINVKVDAGKGYIVEAAVPLASLGLKPAPNLTLRGDVGVTHGDPAGARTRLRTYWSNQETGLVDDVVFELQPTPKNWGEFNFQ